MSIPKVEVNMDGMFTSGQAYVALSRATSAEGLQIKGYNKQLIFTNPSAIKFYKNIDRNKASYNGDEKDRKLGGGSGGHEQKDSHPDKGTATTTTVTTSVRDILHLLA
jgi:hypothetical protein